jgi:hypothetical protein
VCALRVKTGWSSCLPSLHLLKLWSLPQTRRDSLEPSTAAEAINVMATVPVRSVKGIAARQQRFSI